jgi:Xaa-Pro aminopeptidase
MADHDPNHTGGRSRLGRMGEHETVSHDIPMSDQLTAAIAADWDPAPPFPHPARPDCAPYTAARRAALSARFRDQLLVIAAGAPKVRANDTDYPFRATSAFTWLTGETVPEAVLVMTPRGNGHEATLYIGVYAQPGEPEYFTSRTHGAVWVGNAPSVTDTVAALGIETRPLRDLDAELSRFARAPRPSDALLRQVIDELRLVKDRWEIERLKAACDSTARGFADVVRELPNVVGRRDVRGERWLEGTFWRRARLEGNAVGYSAIVGAGVHATTLHWTHNTGAVEPGSLLLADMGVETDELYTADVTRTMPVSGEWSPAQLRVYRAVEQAQAAGIAEVKAGADFVAAHRAAMWVIADHLHSWGVLPVPAEVSCHEDEQRPGAGLHRRYTLHSTSHMLGIDVHDCANARNELYRGGALQSGHALTVEPGLYFQPNDRTVPAEMRGIGVRIEDDIVVTDGDPINLSASLPRDPDEVLEWMLAEQATKTAL